MVIKTFSIGLALFLMHCIVGCSRAQGQVASDTPSEMIVFQSPIGEKTFELSETESIPDGRIFQNGYQRPVFIRSASTSDSRPVVVDRNGGWLSRHRVQMDESGDGKMLRISCEQEPAVVGRRVWRDDIPGVYTESPKTLGAREAREYRHVIIAYFFMTEDAPRLREWLPEGDKWSRSGSEYYGLFEALPMTQVIAGKAVNWSPLNRVEPKGTQCAGKIRRETRGASH